MTIDGIFLFIGLLLNAIVVLYITRLQLRIHKAVVSTGDTVRASAAEITEIHHETNDMRGQLEEVARAEGRLEGRLEGLAQRKEKE